MDNSINLLSQEYRSSQNLVLVTSNSPKRSTKITARAENLLAIHRKILLHLRNEKPLMKFELHKLLAILKRIDCSSPRDQKVAQSAHDILIKCINSQASKEEKTLQRNISNTTSDSSRTNETQITESISDDFEVKRQWFDIRSATPYKNTDNNFTYRFTENPSMLHQTESESDQHFLNPTSVSTFKDSEVNKDLFGVRSEAPYKTDNDLNHGNESQRKQYLFDVPSETPYKTNNNLQYRFTENASTSHQINSEQYQPIASESNIFSSQTTQGDVEQSSFAKEITYSNDKENTSLSTNVALSHAFLRRHLSVNSNGNNDDFDNDMFDINDRMNNDKNAQFTVPTLLENEGPSRFSQGPNVLKLRLTDVQFDSDTLSIPMELLTNLNFGSEEKQLQGASCECTQSLLKKISHNKALSIDTIGKNSQNSDTATLFSDFTQHNNNTSSPNNTNFLKSPFKTANNNYIFTQPNLHTTQENSLNNTANIESLNSEHNFPLAISTTPNEKISCDTTIKSLSGIQAISSFSTNVETSTRNIDIEATNTKTPNSNNSFNLPRNPFMTGVEKFKMEEPKLLLEVPCVRHSQYKPRKKGQVTINASSEHFDNAENDILIATVTNSNAKNASVTNNTGNVDNALYIPCCNVPDAKNHTMEHANTKNVKDTWCIPQIREDLSDPKQDTLNFPDGWYILSNNVADAENVTVTNNINSKNFKNALSMSFENIPDAKNKNLCSETPDLEGNCLLPIENAMEICKSFMDEPGDLEMTEIEKRYLEMAANSAESETNDFCFDQNAKSKDESQPKVDESDKGSFIFNLDTNDSSDIIEGTPYGPFRKKTLHNKIKTLLPKKPGSQGMTKNPIIINEKEDIVIDETPCNLNSETSNIIIDETPCRISESPATDQHYDSTSQSVKVKPRVQTGLKQHALLTPYKLPRSNSFPKMYKSNYHRKSPKKKSASSKIVISKDITIYKEDVSQSQSLGVFTSENKNDEKTIIKPTILDMSDSLSLKRFTNISLITPPPISHDSSENKPNITKNQRISENIVLIDGTHPKNTEKMDITQPEQEKAEETFEEKTRKLREKILQKRNKYKETWNDKPLTEKVSLKYVKKFGINIFQDPVKSLLNIEYETNVNNFHFPRLTLKEINEKLKKSSKKANQLNEALTKMIDLQISSASEEDYKFYMTKAATAPNLDSDDSSDDEETIRKKKLEEIMFMSRLELKKFKEEMEKERKENIRLKRDQILLKESGDEYLHNQREKLTKKEESSKFIQDLRKAGDCSSWLK